MHVRLNDGVIFVTGSGIVQNNLIAHQTVQRINIERGDTLGVSHDLHSRTVTFYHRACAIGTVSTTFAAESSLMVMYPVIGLHDRGTLVKARFDVKRRMSTEVAAFGKNAPRPEPVSPTNAAGNAAH